MRRRVVAFVALTAVALAAGCGGSGDGGGDGGDRLTKEEYIQQADAICADANQKIEALGEPQDFDELAALGEQALSVSEQSLDSLRTLTPPAELESQVNRAYDLLAQQNELAKQLVVAANAGDQAEIEGIVAQAEPLETEADAIAREIGLTQCGQD